MIAFRSIFKNSVFPGLISLYSILLFAYSHEAIAADFRGVGDLPGGDFNTAVNAISGNRPIVVGSSNSEHGVEAFIYKNKKIGAQPLGDLAGGVFFSDALGVSLDGKTVVGHSKSGSGTEAFVWTAETGMQGLGDFSGGAFFSRAEAISDDGSVIVGYGTDANGAEAFIWSMLTGLQGLGDLYGGLSTSHARAVSGNGQVIVGKSLVEAFRWDAVSGMQGLGDLPGGEFRSEALGISANAQFIVGWGTSAAGVEAFIWENGAIQSLGDLPDGSHYSVAMDVSNNGVVVGRATGLNGTEAFIKRPAWNEVRSLREHLLNKYNLGAKLAGWSLYAATAIWDNGRVIAGVGVNPDGQIEGWIADIRKRVRRTKEVEESRKTSKPIDF